MDKIKKGVLLDQRLMKQATKFLHQAFVQREASPLAALFPYNNACRLEHLEMLRYGGLSEAGRSDDVRDADAILKILYFVAARTDCLIL